MAQVRFAAEAPEASSVEAEIARLRGLDIKALRTRWQTSFGREAPPHLARHLLFAMLAYRLQAEVMGDLDAETLRFLQQVDLTPSQQAAVPLTEAFERRRRDLSPGTVLMREWGGQHHRVMVLEGGFAWQGQTYGSLSEIAKSITGTKWNGPRFFGLRDRKPAGATP
ncbi:MAG: DUF2924 domain-containing protein [Pseudolabrys sp.]|jgi:hypothetical protein